MSHTDLTQPHTHQSINVEGMMEIANYYFAIKIITIITDSDKNYQ